MQEVITRITDSRLRKAFEKVQRTMINTPETRLRTHGTDDVDSDQFSDGE